MDIHDQYASEMQLEIALLNIGKANYAVLSRLSIIFEIPDDIERTRPLVGKRNRAWSITAVKYLLLHGWY